jgi:hypothetical protein
MTRKRELYAFVAGDSEEEVSLQEDLVGQSALSWPFQQDDDPPAAAAAAAGEEVEALLAAPQLQCAVCRAERVCFGTCSVQAASVNESPALCQCPCTATCLAPDQHQHHQPCPICAPWLALLRQQRSNAGVQKGAAYDPSTQQLQWFADFWEQNKHALIASHGMRKCYVAPGSQLLQRCIDSLAARAEAGSPELTAAVVHRLLVRQHAIYRREEASKWQPDPGGGVEEVMKAYFLNNRSPGKTQLKADLMPVLSGQAGSRPDIEQLMAWFAAERKRVAAPRGGGGEGSGGGSSKAWHTDNAASAAFISAMQDAFNARLQSVGSDEAVFLGGLDSMLDEPIRHPTDMKELAKTVLGGMPAEVVAKLKLTAGKVMLPLRELVYDESTRRWAVAGLLAACT